MEQDPDTNEETVNDFMRWRNAISRMAKQENVYMKLSGAFSELGDQTPEHPMNPTSVVERVWPWVDHVFNEFGPWRIMFGSDWPVCNVRGPGDAKTWSLWVEVVHKILQARSLSEDERNRVWRDTAIEAYRLDLAPETGN